MQGQAIKRESMTCKSDMNGQKWTTETLYDHFTIWIKEADRRYEDRFKAEKESRQQSDLANVEKFKSQNEWRLTYGDLLSSQMLRPEIETKILAMNDKYELNKSRIDRLEGASAGFDGKWIKIIGVLLLIIAGIDILLKLRGGGNLF